LKTRKQHKINKVEWLFSLAQAIKSSKNKRNNSRLQQIKVSKSNKRTKWKFWFPTKQKTCSQQNQKNKQISTPKARPQIFANENKNYQVNLNSIVFKLTNPLLHLNPIPFFFFLVKKRKSQNFAIPNSRNIITWKQVTIPFTTILLANSQQISLSTWIWNLGGFRIWIASM